MNSVRRLDLERLTAIATRLGNTTVWYVREPASLEFAGAVGASIDVIIANSEPLAEEAASITGRRVAFVGSAIDVAGLLPPQERSALLLVNPTEGFGPEIALEIARALPQRRVVMQESWPLDESTRAQLEERVQELDNLELRRKRPRSQLFQDTYALIAPYSAETAGLSRPRVVLEAQALGVPVVAHDLPGLVSVQASADLLIGVDGPTEQWLAVLDRLDANYSFYCERAAAFAAHLLAPPAEVWRRFARAMSIMEEGQ